MFEFDSDFKSEEVLGVGDATHNTSSSSSLLLTPSSPLRSLDTTARVPPHLRAWFEESPTSDVSLFELPARQDGDDAISERELRRRRKKKRKAKKHKERELLGSHRKKKHKRRKEEAGEKQNQVDISSDKQQQRTSSAKKKLFQNNDTVFKVPLASSVGALLPPKPDSHVSLKPKAKLKPKPKEKEKEIVELVAEPKKPKTETKKTLLLLTETTFHVASVPSSPSASASTAPPSTSGKLSRIVDALRDQNQSLKHQLSKSEHKRRHLAKQLEKLQLKLKMLNQTKTKATETEKTADKTAEKVVQLSQALQKSRLETKNLQAKHEKCSAQMRRYRDEQAKYQHAVEQHLSKYHGEMTAFQSMTSVHLRKQHSLLTSLKQDKKILEAENLRLLDEMSVIQNRATEKSMAIAAQRKEIQLLKRTLSKQRESRHILSGGKWLAVEGGSDELSMELASVAAAAASASLLASSDVACQTEPLVFERFRRAQCEMFRTQLEKLHCALALVQKKALNGLCACNDDRGVLAGRFKPLCDDGSCCLIGGGGSGGSVRLREFEPLENLVHCVAMANNLCECLDEVIAMLIAENELVGCLTQ